MSGANARANQKRRTRKDLLQAAARLLKEGRNPSLEEIAEEALVSRATAYRYFPNVEALLIEAPLDLALPDETALFAGAPTKDPVARMERVDAAFHDMILENETALRLMLAKSMERRVAEGDSALPARQNRRTPMIEAALAPAKSEFNRASLDRLQKALALIVGTEAMIVFRDVLQLDEKEAREVKRWAIRVLIEAARG
ncbi:TetR/AcrR family transcriptional regulator [Parvibaculum sp.]|uniref:TetR/AcrR family transcriptional regulator n=1 Tax=Parvibaculum sp. TaxID=2024848 RepID=UPI0039188A07